MSKKIRTAEIPVLIWSVFLGFILCELFYLGMLVGSVFQKSFDSYVEPLNILIVSTSIVVLGIAYIYLRLGFSKAVKIVKSGRADLLGICVIGGAISVTLGGAGKKYYESAVSQLEIITLFLIFSTPLLFAATQVVRSITRRERVYKPPFFLNDKDIKDKEHDLLNVSGAAERFARRVLNGGSSDSLVFGIDAPWGIGKSSFINFCQEYWAETRDPEIIVYRFEPLRYEQNTDLAEKFAEDLINTIQRSTFAPSLRPVFSKYSRMVRGASDFSLFGLRFEPSPTTVEDTLQTLEYLLQQQKLRVVVVVDDLDRVGWESIKNILFAVKRSFMLPNISYIFCYDTQNVVPDDDGSASIDVREFLEKFINVKISLFVDAQTLAQYVSSNFDAAVKNNLGMESRTLDTVKQAIEQLVSIYQSAEFHQYQDVLGDVRKVKRLINTLMLLEVDQADFTNSDFDKQDLLHLLLIYVGFPHVFRKVYATETNGHNGFFSLVVKSIDGVSRYRNSEEFENYLKNSKSDVVKFLLKQLFYYERLSPDSAVESIDEAERRQKACFNLGESRNLERYLRLIVNLSEPDARDSYQFYLNKKDELVAGLPIEVILNDRRFGFEDGGEARVELWRVLANCSRELAKNHAEKLIENIISTLPQYAFSSTSGVFVGPRIKIIYSLLKILDSGRWLENSYDSDPEQEEIFIADWIFGEGRKTGRGIISTLTNADRGVIGFYDALLFRLYFSADRGNSLFKLQNALSRNAGPSAPTQGSTVPIAIEGMRKISQLVFASFKEKYILTNQNIFSDVDEVGRNELLGLYKDSLPAPQEEFAVFENNKKVDVRAERSNIKSFVVYQLSNALISSGVGCGYYDVTGSSDGAGIKNEMNQYLFDCCFNPIFGDENHEHFLDFLMINFGHVFEFVRGIQYQAQLNEWGKTLNLSMLKKYWEENRGQILQKRLHEKDKVVKNSSYFVNYNTHLAGVFAALDSIGNQPEIIEIQ